MQYYKTQYQSPIGILTLWANDQSLIALKMESQTHHLQATEVAPTRIQPLDAACKWLDDYFTGDRPAVYTLSLSFSGTAFQNRIWQRLLEIPYGQTVTYGQIAAQIAQERGISKMSSQAVGQAVRANPIGIIIPCHRVIGANGSLTGYAGGLKNKIWLLTHEKAL